MDPSSTGAFTVVSPRSDPMTRYPSFAPRRSNNTSAGTSVPETFVTRTRPLAIAAAVIGASKSAIPR